MKISDFIFQYPTFNINDGLCRVRVFNSSKNKVYALITDVGRFNTSASVTNSIESIVEGLIIKGLVPKSTEFIEHYEKTSIGLDTFDLISFSDENKPVWIKISKAKLQLLLECGEEELNSSVKNELRLVSEIEKIRYKMRPSMNFDYQKRSELITRAEDIKNNMISKKELKDLINSKAKEQDISRLLKRDLSFFAELYADPKDEYICFSEFPLGEGIVDYVVFTGRSRMDVYLIEVKGADFNFLNTNGDNIINKNIENATRQVENRLGLFHRRYEEFRQKFHRIRLTVENGEVKYNSFQGPHAKLLVDPNKDVNVYAVIIGGRTGDDYKESLIRNDFEYNKNLPVKLETWDTWIRKLSRD